MPLKLLGIGLVAGLFSALFGVGGGIVIVPLLILLLGFQSRSRPGHRSPRSGSRRSPGRSSTRSKATSTSRTRRSSGCRPPAGAIVGTALQQRVSGRALTLAFAGLLAALAVWLLLVDERDHDRLRGAASASRPACSPGFFGVGGGILFVPTLVALGLSQLDAEATSLLAILPTVAAGTWRQRHYGNVRWRTALVLGARVDRRRRGRRPDRDGAARGRAEAPLRGAPARRRRATRMAVAPCRPRILREP